MENSKIVIDIAEHEFPGKLLNINSMRGQSRYIGHWVAPWRQLGKAKALAAGIPTQTRPVTIWVYFRFPNNRRRDTGNLFPTSKALVDGLVDAQVLPDDCDGIVYGPHQDRDYPNGPPRIRLTIEPKEMP